MRPPVADDFCPEEFTSSTTVAFNNTADPSQCVNAACRLDSTTYDGFIMNVRSPLSDGIFLFGNSFVRAIRGDGLDPEQSRAYVARNGTHQVSDVGAL